MYDIARLHAATNDLPAALLLAAVIFDLLAAATKRESLRAAGFWTLIVGTVGAGLALVTGLLAEDAVEHGDAMHAVMEQHETLAIVTTALFAVIALWRIIRRGRLGPREQPILLTAAVIGVGLLVATATRGGALVFEYGGGIPTASLQRALDDRGAHSHEEGSALHEHDDSTNTPAEGAAPHEHGPQTPPHTH